MGRLTSPRSQGFTLLELLVALVVISVMLAVVTPNLMPDARSQLRDEATRLAFLLENGGNAAQAGGQSLAWSGSHHHYRFWRKTLKNEWVRLEQDTLLHPRTLPDEIYIDEIRLEGRPLTPGNLLALSPELALRPFSIRLHNAEHVAWVNGNGLGAVSAVMETP